VEQPSEALHEASACRHAKQDGPVHLFSGRKLCEAVGDGLRRDHHGDGSPVPVAWFFVWHARGMPDDGRSDVEDASTDVGFFYKCGFVELAPMLYECNFGARSGCRFSLHGDYSRIRADFPLSL
jgi:hypothetical protein